MVCGGINRYINVPYQNPMGHDSSLIRGFEINGHPHFMQMPNLLNGQSRQIARLSFAKGGSNKMAT